MKKYPLLQSQLGVFMECLKYPDSTQYNLPALIKIDDSIDLDRLVEAERALIKSSAIFRNRYEIDADGTPWQWSDEDMPIDIVRRKCNKQELDAYTADGFVRPYDLLSGEPLFRMEIVETEAGNYQLFDMHHTITDGFGNVKLASKILDRCYKGKPVPFDDIIYKLAEQEAGLTETPEYIAAQKYFTEKFRGQEFVTLSKGDGTKLGRMLLVSNYVDKQCCDDWCKDNEVRIDLLFQLAFCYIMSVITRNYKVVYGTPFHGRNTKEKMKAAGMFVNTVPVLADMTGTLTVREAIERLKQELDLSFANAIYPIRHLFTDIHNFPKLNFNFRASKSLSPDYKIDGTVSPCFELTRGLTQDDMDISIILAGDRYHIRMESSSAMNDKKTMEMLGNAIEAVVNNVVHSSTDIQLQDISIISETEKAEIMAMSTGPRLEFDTTKTWLNMFEHWVETQPEHVAVVDKAGQLTYAELDKASDKLASYLMTHGVQPNDFVVIKLHRVKEFAVAVIGVQKAGACYIPIDPNYPEERINFMESDSRAKVVLDEALIADILASTDTPGHINIAAPENLAYTIYTSGSTGRPKGAMLSHRALMNYTQIYTRRFEITPEDRISHHITFSFDSHIRDFYPALAGGASLNFMPDEICREPDEIYRFLEENRITGSAYATAMGQLLLNGYELHQRFISIGGEALLGIKTDNVRVFNVCGATECTDVVVDHELVPGKYYDSVPIGKPLPNCYAFILDKYNHLLPQGVAGEICYAGPHIGDGYWNLPEKTAASFVDCPFAIGQRMYHTGDLGRYNEDGEVEYLGRIDFQVKLRGFRVELGEVESRAIQFTGMKQVVAAVKNDNLVLYYTAEADIDEAELKAFMGETLTEYMVPSIFMKLEALPMTPSGKIDRKALPEPEVVLGVIIAPETETEKDLFAVASQQLKREDFGVTTNLVGLGMNSIMAMRLTALIKDKLGARVRVSDVMKAPDIRSIAGIIDAGLDQELAIEHIADREYYPITENQRGVYIDWEMNRDTTQYNIPAVYKFTDKNAEKLAEALKTAINAHGVLKTKFALKDNDVVQVPHYDEPAEVSVINSADEPTEDFFQSRVKPFDLLNDRLYRAEVYSYGDEVYIFLDIHHTVFDGLSTAVLMQDIQAAYEGRGVTEEIITAYDLAVYENELLESEKFSKAEAYYDALVGDANAVSYPDSRLADNTNIGNVEIRFESEKIDTAAAKNGVTVASYLNAAFGEALQRITREGNPMYLTIFNGREADARLANCVGMFVKTLPVVLHTENHGKESVADFVKGFHNQLQDTIDNDFYPYTNIVEKHGLRGEIMFVYQGGLLEGGLVDGAEIMPLSLDIGKFPITATAYPLNGSYVLSIEYDGMRYAKKDMLTLLNAVKNTALSMAVADKVSDVEMVSPEEKDSIIELSTGNTLEYNTAETWIDMFKLQAAKHSDFVAVVDSVSKLTYGELDRQSDAIACYLIEHGVKPNDFVAIKMGRVKEFIVAVLGIQKAGAAYVPVDPDYPEERISYMLANSEARFVLDEAFIAEILQAPANVDSFTALAKPENYAYMIYTSGSTGKPKGAVVYHKGLRAFIAWQQEFYHYSESSRNVIHPSFSFDASINDIFPPLAAGGQVHILSAEIRQDMDGMFSYIKENGITGMTMSTQIGMAMVNNYDLPMEFVAMGGEKVLPMRPQKLRVVNVYGPTEFTCISAVHDIDLASEQEVPIGKSVPNTMNLVCDQYGRLVPRGVTGELCLAGRQLGAGYWKLPEKTAEVFVDCQYMSGEKMYRTGDLVRYNENGDLEYLGRIDFQVKLRGFRIELGEVENRAAIYDGIKLVIAQVKKDQLVLYYTAEGDIDKSALKAFMAEVLTEYMVPSIYIQLAEMPMTPGGKIDRKALPEPEVELGEIIAPATELEKKLFAVVSEQLNRSDFGVTNNLVSLGMSSLSAMRLSVAINNKLAAKVRVADIMKAPTVREIAVLLEQTEGGQQEVIQHIEAREYYPITENQRGIYIDWEMNRDTTQYNTPAVYKFTNKNDKKLAEALRKAINAHGALKTRFAFINNDVVQVPHYNEPAEVAVINVEEEPTASFFQSRVKPFDLFKDRLYRAEVYSYGEDAYLFLDIHHTVYDGLSTTVFMQDVLAAYDGKDVTAEELTAYDFAVYEQELLNREEFVKAESYYDTLVSDATAVSYGDSRQPDGNMTGTVEVAIASEQIDAACARNGVTVSSYLNAAFAEAMHRLTREENPMYLTISNGREADSRLANCVGMFVKTLPVVLHTENHGQETVAEFVKGFHNQLQATIANDFYPYTNIVEKHGLRGEVMFVYQGGLFEGGSLDGVETIPLNLDTSKLPVLVTAYPLNESYVINIEYDGMRYAATDMLLLANAIGNAAVSMAKAEKIADIKLVTEAETKALMELGCGPVMERDHSETIISMFKARGAATPDATAVVFKDKSYTYAELDRISDNLAVYLKKNYNIQPEENVGVLINRSELMLIYPLAVMKNGAAYMPLDPHFPTDRLQFMCDDASVRLVLSEGTLLEEKLPGFVGYSFNSSAIADLPVATPAEIKALQFPQAHNRLVIIFTSGSTGKPKAVDLEHFGVVNFCHWYASEFELTMADHVAGYANFGFDAHMIDMYPSILAGSAVYIFDEEMRMDVNGMNAYMEENNISVAFLTTQIGCIIREINHSLRYLSTGGEKMPPVTPPDFRFLNVYGPTECSLFSTYYDVKGYFEGEYIGYPLANYQLYVVNKNCQLVPRGVAGELLIAGAGVARGYLNRPELTADKFIMFKPSADSESVRAYRSGDLVRWSENDGIQFLGRIDKQVKLRGLRIELGEIENRAAAFAGINQVVVDVKKEQLCCYYVANSEIDTASLKSHLAEKLAEFMVPEIYMQLDELPLNANGKVDRKALPEPEVKLEEIIAPATELEKKVFTVVSEQFNKSEFGVTNNLISLGMSSLAAMRLSAAINNELKAQVRVADIMKEPTVRGIAALLEKGEGVQQEAIKHVEPRAYYPITENQRGIYLDWEMNRDTTQYNIPGVYKFNNRNAGKLSEALRTVINAHGELKTRFALMESDLVQIPHFDEPAVVSVIDSAEEPTAKFFQSRVKPFDLFNDRLYRAEVYSYGDEVYLFLDIHHTVFDGLSTTVLMQDVLASYDGREVTEEEITAYDFAVYEQELIKGDRFAKAESYYDALVANATAISYAASKGPDGRKTGSVEVSVACEQIDAACARNGVTASSYMNAAFAEALKLITREANQMYLTISNGREDDARLAGCVGMFVKTLPVVIPTESHTNGAVADFLKSFHKQLQETISNDFYPYTRLVEKHNLKGEVMFIYQGGVMDVVPVGSGIESININLDTAKLPIAVTVAPADGKYFINVEYDGMRYSAEDMNRLAEAFANTALNMAVAETLGEVSMVSEAAKNKLIELSAGEKLSYDATETWLDMFKRQAAMHGAAAAVVDSVSSITYAELYKQSDAVAGYLVGHGVKPNDFIAIKMGRVKEFVVAVLGIQKTGAAYVPVDPEYPEERISYMLENSGARFVLDEAFIAEILKAPTSEMNFEVLAKPENYAYMIYTSGSTGKPKGVIQTHRSLRAFMEWRIKTFEITADSHHAQHPSFAFDASIVDLLPPLAAGGQVHILNEAVRRDVDLMHQYFEDNAINVVAMSTQIGMALINQYPDSSLKYMSVGGEKLLPFARTKVRFINEYGPTEFTICSAYQLIDQSADGNIPIGRPVPNTYSFICDPNGNLMPAGMVGELCLAGPQLGAGYWQLPEKTAEVFVACPFMPGMQMYRTGDLARYNKKGELEYIGRIDFQVKLRGFRIELGEVENQAAAYEGIRQVNAQVKKEQLVLYYTANTTIAKAKLKDFMAEALTSYMVPTVYMQLDKLPMTPNGKVDLKALPEPVFTSSEEFVAPATSEEIAIAEAMQKILGITEPIGALDSFLELGGDSIKAIRTVSLLRQKGIGIQVADIMKLKTVRRIASAVSSSAVVISQEPFEGEVKDSAIVSFFKHLELPEAHYFNQSQRLKLRERAAVKLLKQAFDAITYQHDMLRAVWKNDALVVRPAGTVIPIAEYTISDLSETENICMELQSTIKMSEALVRVALLHAPEADYLFIVAHHLVVDGVSWRIIVGDLEMAYTQLLKGESIALPLKTSTYNDYAEALHRYRDSYVLGLELKYWKTVQSKLLAGSTSVEKNYDRQMAGLAASLSKEETYRFTRANMGIMNVNINDTLLTAVCSSYAKVTGEDIVSIQFEGHGRENIASDLVTDRTVGWFTSAYPVVVDGIGDDLYQNMIQVKEAMHRLPNNGVGYNILRFIEGEEKVDFLNERIAKLGFNYLGEMDGEQSPDSFFTDTNDISTGMDFSEKNKFGTDIAMNCYIANGRFSISFMYNTAVLSADDAKKLLYGILDEMRAIPECLDHCQAKTVTPSDLGENEWSISEFNRIMEEYAEQGETISRIYSLTPMQDAMLFQHASEPEGWAYRLVSIFEINKLPTEEQLVNVLERLAKKHEVLRTAIIYDGVGVSRQAIVERRLGLKLLDFTNETNPEAAVKAYREDVLTNGYDLQRKPLFQLTCIKKSQASCYLVMATHHIIVDGWCINLYVGDFFRYLNEELTGHYSKEPEAEKGVYEAAVREILQKDKKAGLNYWRELLAGYDTRAEIPSYGEVPENEQSENDEFTAYVDADITEKLNKLCKEEQATFSNVLELAWGLVLQTYSRTEDAVFAKVVSGRDNTKVDVNNVVGLFINSVPVRVNKNKGETSRQLLQTLHKQAVDSNAYDFCPLAEIQQQSELGGQLFQNVIAFENYNSGLDTSSQKEDNTLAFAIHPILVKEETFDEITPSLYITDDNKIALHIAFNRKHYRLVEIERVTELFRVLITGIADNPDKAVSALPLINSVMNNSVQELIELGRGKAMEYDRSETIVSIFRKRVMATPDAIAVVFKDKSYTYAELDRISDNLAVYLKKNYNIQPEENVGVMINRSELMLIYPLAVMKNGAAYMPLDPHFPTDRLQFMCDDASVKLVLSEGNLLEEKLPEYTGNQFNSGEISDIPEATAEEVAALTFPTAHNRLVIIFTSGSTGKPKAVDLEHCGVTNFCHWYVSEFELSMTDHVAGYANFGFDAHMIDMYPSILAGSAVYIFDEEMRMDVNGMNAYMEENNISVAFLTTQVGCIIREINHSLRYLSTGGEKMPPVTPPDFRFLNVYGPTECSLFSTYYDVKGYFEGEYIGYPLANYQLYVVDKNCQLVPRGVAGELLIAGAGVARGYLNRPELTAEKFIMFKPSADSEPVRAYRSADLVRWSENDGIQFLGRLDKQVKLRGLRIELGEIENCVASFAGIKQVIVDVKNDQLCCYYVADSQIDKAKLKEHLAEKLTDYMVPDIYMQLETMPLNANGKIDRKALPDVQYSFELENEPPENPNEFMILRTAREILPGIEFGVTDDLIKLGMTSIKSMRLITKINSELDMRIKFQEIVRFKTIRNVLQGTRRISWLYKEYDSAKPVLALPHGVIEPIDMVGLKSTWGKYFNLLIIEPLYAHYDALFDGDYFDDVAELYTMQVEMLLPADAKLAGFMGFSFGGELAFAMANKWYKAKGDMLPVIMGDTYLHDEQDIPVEQIKLEIFEEVKEEYHKYYPEFTDEYIQGMIKAHNSIALVCRKIRHEGYMGKTIYLNALKGCAEEDISRKLQVLRKYAANIEMHDFENLDHNDMYKNPVMFPLFEELAARIQH